MSSLEELLKKQFKQLEVTPKNHTKNLAHLHADFAEIIALLRNEDFFSATDLINRYKSFNIRVKDLGIDCDEDASEAEVDDVYSNWAHQVFMILQDRQSLYGDDYPFDVEASSIKLMNLQLVEGKKKIYIALLLSANLNHFRKLQDVLTSDFEHLSFSALKEFIPKAKVRQFGKNSDYSGTAQEKISALASDMMEVDLNQREFKKILGNQERGIDIVGWYPFSDKYSNFLSILAQCACGKDWYKKLNETKRFHNYFRYEKLNPIHALFVPGALFSKAVEYDGDFFQSDEFNDVLIFERLRILEYIKSVDALDGLDTNKVVEFTIMYQEDLV